MKTLLLLPSCDSWMVDTGY